jgi:hypothetical protein
MLSGHDYGSVTYPATVKYYNCTLVSWPPNLLYAIGGFRVFYPFARNAVNRIPHSYADQGMAANCILVMKGGDRISLGSNIGSYASYSDGNLYYQPDGGNFHESLYRSSAAPTSWTDAGAATFATLAAFRASADFVNSSKVNTSPNGWDSRSVQIDPQFRSFDWSDAYNDIWPDLRPQAASAKTGAIDLSKEGFGDLPGVEAVSYRGALDPGGDGSEAGPRPLEDVSCLMPRLPAAGTMAGRDPKAHDFDIYNSLGRRVLVGQEALSAHGLRALPAGVYILVAPGRDWRDTKAPSRSAKPTHQGCVLRFTD